MSSASVPPASVDPARAAVVGIGAGCALVAVAWVLELAFAGVGRSPQELWAMHLQRPSLWLVEMAPVVLGAVGAWWGGRPRAAVEAPAPAPEPPSVVVDTRTGSMVRIPDEVAQALFRTSLDGILVLGEDDRILLVNRACARIFGYRVHELVGGQIDRLIPRHGDQEATHTSLRRTAQDDVLGIEMQVEGLHRSGEAFPIELTDTVVDLHGRLVHLYQLRDISERLTHERKMREINEMLADLRDQALDASRAKSAFLANMSHEIRTPLNAVLGYSEMLEEELEDLELHRLVPDLRKIRAAGRHLLELINSILDLSKIEAGKMELHPEEVDVRALLGELQELADPLAARNRNSLEVSFVGAPGHMLVDAVRLRQVLLNVLGNACKFTEDGTVSLEVERSGPDGREWLSFRIADTGIGMTDEQLCQLFQEFRQGDAGTTRRYGGTGLGLAISRRFCLLMGGDISVHSALGEGSTFTVRLPAVAEPVDDIEPAPIPVEGTGQAGGRAAEARGEAAEAGGTGPAGAGGSGAGGA